VDRESDADNGDLAPSGVTSRSLQEVLSPEEREELRQRRRENARLREEREILNRTAASFAWETDQREYELVPLILISGLLLVAAEIAAFRLVRSVVRFLRPPRHIAEECGADRRRVLVLTAPVGEGHVAAARAIVAELEEEDGELEVVLVDALDGIGRVLRFILHDAYRWQFGHAARAYGLAYRLLERSSFCRSIGQLTIVSFGSRPLLRMVKRIDPDIVVSTHPPVTCVLGHLRRRNRIRVPVVATITDLDGLGFWVHPGADLHLVMHESCIAQVERLAGPGSARCARPLLAPAFREPRTRAQARRALGLPEAGAIAVVSGGGWGVGELEDAARAALEIEDLSVICLAGRSESTRRRLELAFAAEARVSVWGFTDGMSDLLAAADALVHSTGGVTVLEALARNCPVIAYGAPPGHARLTAKALVKQGLGRLALSPEELAASLRSVLERPRAAAETASSAPSCARLVLEATPRPTATPALGARLARRAALTTVALIFPVWAFSTDLPYALAANVLDVAPLNVVSTRQADVGIVVSAPPSLVPGLVAELRLYDAHASFAFSAPVDKELLSSLARAQDEPLPALGSGEAAGWLHTRDHLNDLVAALRVRGDRYYLAPDTLTFGQYLLARGQGALPIRGSRINPGEPAPSRGLVRGDVVVLELGEHRQEANAALDGLLTTLARDGLRGVSVGQLRESRSNR
jgi:processive 1,2-diacylglycerol beta-glucosyltransferase